MTSSPSQSMKQPQSSFSALSVSSLAKTVGIWAGGLLIGLGLPYLPHLGNPRSLVGDLANLSDRGLGLPFLTKPFDTVIAKNNNDNNNNNNNNNNNTVSSSTAATATVVAGGGVDDGHRTTEERGGGGGGNEEEKEEERTFVCDGTHSYRTELVSLEPLIVYVHDLITPAEISWLLETGESRFAPSQVAKYGRAQVRSPERTSSSAGLPRDDPAVMCVLNRTRAFLGTMLRDGWDEMGPPQLVRYTAGQHFDLHHDWFDVPQRAVGPAAAAAAVAAAAAAASATSNDGKQQPFVVPRKWNRVASFFAILEDDCTGGETYFPYAKPIVPPSPRGEALWQGGGGGVEDGKKKKRTKKTEGEEHEEEHDEHEEVRPLWREHEDGGLAFRPVAGNAIFWVNLHPNGTGDTRTNHAGLPLESGRKTAMNIWPRQYYP